MYYNPHNLKNAKEMRSNMTPAETKMWRFLRGKRFQGLKFKRQVLIGNYIVDLDFPTLILARSEFLTIVDLIDLTFIGNYSIAEIKEQIKIGKFLSNLDNLITLHQSKQKWEFHQKSHNFLFLGFIVSHCKYNNTFSFSIHLSMDI